MSKLMKRKISAEILKMAFGAGKTYVTLLRRY